MVSKESVSDVWHVLRLLHILNLCRRHNCFGARFGREVLPKQLPYKSNGKQGREGVFNSSSLSVRTVSMGRRGTHGPGCLPCQMAAMRPSGNDAERSVLDNVPVRPLPAGRGAVMRIRAEPNSGLSWTNDPQTNERRPGLVRHGVRHPSSPP